MSQKEFSKSDSVSPASANPKREKIMEQSLVLGVHVWPIEIPKDGDNYEWTMKCCVIRKMEDGRSIFEAPDTFQLNILLAKQRDPFDSFESFNSTHTAKQIIKQFQSKFPERDRITDIVVVHNNVPCDGKYIARALANHVQDTRGYIPRFIGITEWDFFQTHQLADVREASVVLRESPYYYVHPLHAQLTSEPNTSLNHSRLLLVEQFRKALATIDDAHDINPLEITVLAVGNVTDQTLQEFKDLPICGKLAKKEFVIHWRKQADPMVRDSVAYAAAVHALHYGTFSLTE